MALGARERIAPAFCLIGGSFADPTPVRIPFKTCPFRPAQACAWFAEWIPTRRGGFDALVGPGDRLTTAAAFEVPLTTVEAP